MNLVSFISQLKSQISASSTINVYLEQAPSNARYPYVTYYIPDSIGQETREDFTLRVDVWGKIGDGDTLDLEDLVDDLSNGLNEWKYNDDDLQISVYRNSRNMIPNSDERIRQRRLIYTCQVYR